MLVFEIDAGVERSVGAFVADAMCRHVDTPAYPGLLAAEGAAVAQAPAPSAGAQSTELQALDCLARRAAAAPGAPRVREVALAVIARERAGGGERRAALLARAVDALAARRGPGDLGVTLGLRADAAPAVRAAVARALRGVHGAADVLHALAHDADRGVRAAATGSGDEPPPRSPPHPRPGTIRR